MFIAAGSDFSGDKVMVRGGEIAETRTAARMGGGGCERLHQVRLIKENDVRAGNAKRQDSSIFRKTPFSR